MNAKETMRNKAAQWLAENQPDLEQMTSTNSRNRLVDSLFAELIECWIQGVGIGANLAAETEPPDTPMSELVEVLV